MRQLIRRIEALEDKIKPSKEYQQEVDRWADLFGMAEVDDPQVMARVLLIFAQAGAKARHGCYYTHGGISMQRKTIADLFEPILEDEARRRREQAAFLKRIRDKQEKPEPHIPATQRTTKEI